MSHDSLFHPSCHLRVDHLRGQNRSTPAGRRRCVDIVGPRRRESCLEVHICCLLRSFSSSLCRVVAACPDNRFTPSCCREVFFTTGFSDVLPGPLSMSSTVTVQRDTAGALAVGDTERHRSLPVVNLLSGTVSTNTISTNCSFLGWVGMLHVHSSPRDPLEADREQLKEVCAILWV